MCLNIIICVYTDKHTFIFKHIDNYMQEFERKYKDSSNKDVYVLSSQEYHNEYTITRSFSFQLYRHY